MKYLCPLVLLACTNDKVANTNFRVLTPMIVTSPEVVDFGGVTVPYTGSTSFQIINAGQAVLEIEDIVVLNNGSEDAGPFRFQIIPQTDETTGAEDQQDTASEVAETSELPYGFAERITVMPTTQVEVLMHFAPETYRIYQRSLQITSNDTEQPLYDLNVSGEGVDGPVPDIALSPQAVDFGTINNGVTSTQFFTLSNRGSGPLLIEKVTLEGSSSFAIATPFEGVEYGLEQSSTIVVTYSPTEEGGDNATITIESTDPDEPVSTVTLLGNGGGDFEYPIADFNCPSEVDPPTTWQFNGSASSDPNGNVPLTYSWELVEKPSGSSTRFDDPDGEMTPFFVDVSGDYKVRLTVMNSVGISSEPTECSFNAKPDESIHVELSWDTNNSDLDLHMVLEGYDFYSLDGDCCWCNPNPNWGNPGNADDPSLSLDNRLGYGPEVIHIDSPYDGWYNINVHYFNNNGGGDTTATVRIYLDGVLIGQEAALMSNHELWDVGFIYWSSGVGQFQAENESPQTELTFRCF